MKKKSKKKVTIYLGPEYFKVTKPCKDKKLMKIVKQHAKETVEHFKKENWDLSIGFIVDCIVDDYFNQSIEKLLICEVHKLNPKIGYKLDKKNYKFLFTKKSK